MANTIHDDRPTKYTKKITSRTTLSEIREMLAEDGYAHVDATQVRAAAAKGCLVWTSTHLRTTDASRIDTTPQTWGAERG